jgi:hypothetical protein
VNPLQRAGASVGRAWGKSTRGTARTLNWVKDGIADGFGNAAGRVRSIGSDESSKPGEDAKTRSKTADAKSAAEGPGLLDRVGLGGLAQRAREDRRVAIAELGIGLLIVIWIAWTIYVWSENGSTAGLGVLISWPAVIAILALIAAPFVGAGVLVRRMANGDGSVAVVEAPKPAEKDAKTEEEPDEDEDEDEESEGDAEDESEEKS